MTPRGAHVFISQTGLCLLEYVLDNESIDMQVEDYRTFTREGRMKIVELNQKYRREIVLGNDIQGRMDLTRLRWGKLPMIKMDFDIANRAITGELIGVLAPKRMPQMNSDILKN